MQTKQKAEALGFPLFLWILCLNYLGGALRHAWWFWPEKWRFLGSIYLP